MIVISFLAAFPAESTVRATSTYTPSSSRLVSMGTVATTYLLSGVFGMEPPPSFSVGFGFFGETLIIPTTR